MRKYQLIPPEVRTNIDLRDFVDKIMHAVLNVMPFARVNVDKSFYTVDPSPYRTL